MDFSWTTEQLEFRESVLAFARQVLQESEGGRGAAVGFSRSIWRQCAEFGIQGLPFPPEYGGSSADVLTTTLAMEALGYGCRDQGLLFSIHAHMWSVAMPLLSFGTPDQKDRYLRRLCDGSWIGGHGMTEPDSGSDAYGLRTRAEERGNGYVLNGTKMFVTNAPEADLFVIFATVDAQKGLWGITAFLVERETPGLVVGQPIAKLGLTSSPMAEVVLEDCLVPKTNVLGRIGQGPAIFGHSMGWERACILASTVGAMEWQLESCLRYAKTRRLLYRAAWSQQRGAMSALEAAMAKLYVSEAAVQSALDAIQIHGGYGYMKEFEVERDLRDAVGSRLYSGTSEIQRLIIARSLGLSPV